MIASWPSKIKNHKTYSGLINFNDFYATFSDILGVEDDSDGESLMDIFSDNKIKKRDITTIYYDPMSFSPSTSKLRNVFSQDHRYKLYQNGDFFDMEKDILEVNPLNQEDLDNNEKNIKAKLAFELEFFPQLPRN